MKEEEEEVEQVELKEWRWNLRSGTGGIKGAETFVMENINV